MSDFYCDLNRDACKNSSKDVAVLLMSGLPGRIERFGIFSSFVRFVPRLYRGSLLPVSPRLAPDSNVGRLRSTCMLETIKFLQRGPLDTRRVIRYLEMCTPSTWFVARGGCYMLGRYLVFEMEGSRDINTRQQQRSSDRLYSHTCQGILARRYLCFCELFPCLTQACKVFPHLSTPRSFHQRT